MFELVGRFWDLEESREYYLYKCYDCGNEIASLKEIEGLRCPGCELHLDYEDFPDEDDGQPDEMKEWEDALGPDLPSDDEQF